ncbi:MAG: sigma-70 family RNA polymerase sigma factor, partial [Candidatus Saccharimonadales bacterium]
MSSQEHEAPRTRKWQQEEAEVKTLLGLSKLPNQTLTETEWQGFARRLATGDSSVEEELLNRRLRTLYGIAKRFAQPSDHEGLTIEDHFQHAAEGLLEGVREYNPLKHSSLRERVGLGMFSALYNYAHRASKGQASESSEKHPPIVTLSLNRLGAAALVSDTDLVEHTASTVRNETLVRALARLPKRESEIIICRVGLGYTFRELGKRLGLSATRIGELEKKAIRSLGYNPEVQTLPDSTETVPAAFIVRGALNTRLREHLLNYRRDTDVRAYRNIKERGSSEVAALAEIIDRELHRLRHKPEALGSGMREPHVIKRHTLLERIEKRIGQPIHYGLFLAALWG